LNGFVGETVVVGQVSHSPHRQRRAALVEAFTTVVTGELIALQ